jgi:diacylglycerol kinase (ATP)
MNTAKTKRAGIIINPVSGGTDKKQVLEEIRKNFPSDIEYDIIVWERPDQKEEIIQKIRERNYDIVVAAGGDGTINQVAQAIKDTDSVLGIIPLGSGNGLARHLNIPMDIKKAIALIGNGREIRIDACIVNNMPFFCTSGIGFDALIGKLFAESKTRGFLTYVRLTFSNFIKYQPQNYTLLIDGIEINSKAFLITFANASQYGNNAYIAPQADISDGFIDVVILKPFKLWQMIPIGSKMFNKTLNTSSYVEVYRGQNISVTRQKPGPVHFDGEPEEMENHIQYRISKGSVRAIVPA